ncbi:unnamed protein product, partial [Ectocarpus fasciculatus]
VVGGGIGGLAAAIALQRAGVHCTVYERDEAFKHRREGFGLTLTNNPKGPLAALGLLDACIDADCPSVCHWVFKPDGAILGYYGRYFKDMTESKQPISVVSSQDALKIRDRGNLRIPRQDLREMLLRQLQPDTVLWGRRLESITDDPQEEHVALHFAGEAEEARAHVVVGADGVHSQVRRIRDTAMLTRKQLSYLGVAVIIGISPVTSPLLHHQGFYVVDGTHRLFTMPFRSEGAPIGDGSGSETADSDLTMWQLSFSGLSEEEALNLRRTGPAAIVQEALRRTETWFDAVLEMIRSSLLTDVWATPLYDRAAPVLVPRPKESLSRLTVLGDACHPMSMFKGQGANQALQDGVLLAKWLGGESSPEPDENVNSKGRKRKRLSPATSDAALLATRLRCFEREMVDRAAPKVAASRTAAEQYHSSVALEMDYGIEGLESGGRDRATTVTARSATSRGELE